MLIIKDTENRQNDKNKGTDNDERYTPSFKYVIGLIIRGFCVFYSFIYSPVIRFFIRQMLLLRLKLIL